MLNVNEQKLLLEILVKEKITYNYSRNKEIQNSQTTYKSTNFFQHIKFLEANGLVKQKIIDGKTFWELSFLGKIRASLIAKDKNVDEKTKEYIHEYRVLPW